MEMLKKKVSLLPAKPGVYLMKNAAGNIIYVGKAKVLKHRVRSYFSGSHDQKTQKLVSEIKDLEYILTSSEVEALLLECNLIKKFSPPYNIMLKDDKSYPYLLITSEKHPRILITRQVNKKFGKYFGPYPNAAAARETARLLNRLLPLRKCRQLPSKSCLYLHLGQCLGPCIQEIEPAAYAEIVEKACSFLRGNQKNVVKWLEDKMKEAAEALQYEAAREYRELIADLHKIREKQNITLNDFRNRDIVAYACSAELISIQVFCFRQGSLVTRDSFIFPYYEEAEESFITFLVQYYSERPVIPDEICIPELKSSPVQDILPVVIPKKGKIRHLIDLAHSNAQIALEEKSELENEANKESRDCLDSLADLLEISQLQTIEAFDISGLSGTNVVGGMIKLIDGKPSRSEYRKFNILSAEKNRDDTNYLKEVVSRRYSRLIREHSSFPDLILVDGGKAQVKAVVKVLRELGLTIPVAGMVKDDRHQTRGLIRQDGTEVSLDAYPKAYRLLYLIQEEVHRFAITFHRQQRGKNMISSELDHIPGIGPKRRRLLLTTFQNLDNIKKASVSELVKAGLPAGAAQNVCDFFRENK